MYYTYKQPEGDLHQGDILKINDDIKDVLSKYHPYYASHDDYSHLIVLTQSCDLVRHNGDCKSRYISLAAVRSLDTAIYREIEKHKRTNLEKKTDLCDIEKKKWFEDFLRKLFNNNHPSFFFLEKDYNFDFDERRVAFLHLSVPIKANIHYKICLDARVLQLTQVFQAKLGWLVGNLYSRVGTPDWVGEQGTPEAFKKLIESISGEVCVWLDKKAIDYIREKLKRESRQSGDDDCLYTEEKIQDMIKIYAEEEEKKYEKVIDTFISESRDTLGTISDIQWGTLKRRLMGSRKLKKTFSE